MKPTLKAPATERLKLQYDEPSSNFAFNFNLRRYRPVTGAPLDLKDLTKLTFHKNADGEYECPVLNKTFTVEPGRRCSRHVISCN